MFLQELKVLESMGENPYWNWRANVDLLKLQVSLDILKDTFLFFSFGISICIYVAGM